MVVLVNKMQTLVGWALPLSPKRSWTSRISKDYDNLVFWFYCIISFFFFENRLFICTHTQNWFCFCPPLSVLQLTPPLFLLWGRQRRNKHVKGHEKVYWECCWLVQIVTEEIIWVLFVKFFFFFVFSFQKKKRGITAPDPWANCRDGSSPQIKLLIYLSVRMTNNNWHISFLFPAIKY